MSTVRTFEQKARRKDEVHEVVVEKAITAQPKGVRLTHTPAHYRPSRNPVTGELESSDDTAHTASGCYRTPPTCKE